MKAKLEDVTVATDGFQCRQLRWEDGNVWSWVNPAKVQADLKAAKRDQHKDADKDALESLEHKSEKIEKILATAKIDTEKKDALCGLWEEERRYDADDKLDKVLTWPEYLDKKLAWSQSAFYGG